MGVRSQAPNLDPNHRLAASGVERSFFSGVGTAAMVDRYQNDRA